MTKDATIQPVSSEADLKAVESLAKDIWEEHYIPIIGAAQVKYMLGKYQSVEAMTTQIQEGTEYYKIMYIDTLVGYFSFLKNDESLFLSKLYVKKDFRGNGLAKNALDFISSKAIEKNCESISLTVNKDNVLAIKAYHKIGFKNVKSQVVDIGDGFVMDDYVMVKNLL